MTVAYFSHEIESDCHITVGGDSQAADIKTVNMTERGDIVVTQDIGLAAIVLAKGGLAIGPAGQEYREENIDSALAEREIKAKFRRSGGRTKGPSKRTAEDDSGLPTPSAQCWRVPAKKLTHSRLPASLLLPQANRTCRALLSARARKTMNHGLCVSRVP